MHVFVSIEMRGQSVDSELKYNYRKSVHRVLQYILDIPQHRKAMKVCLHEQIQEFLSGGVQVSLTKKALTTFFF